MKALIIICFSMLMAANLLFAQSPYTNVLISSSGGPNEVSICMNPKNTNQVVAGANLNFFYYSTNGGANWTSGSMTSSTYGVWGDPIIDCDTAGSFYYFHLSNPSGGNWIDRIVCQKSTNGGVAWNNPGTFMGLNGTRNQDKHGIGIDRTHGPRGNWIYVTWTQFDSYASTNPLDSSRIMFARSSDGGNTWSAALRLGVRGGDCRDQDYTVEGAVPCVGPNGELYDAWVGPQSLNNFKVFFNKSTDGGTTWLANDIIAASQPGGWDYVVAGIYRNNGLPNTLCDISGGTFNGNIYINYTDSAGPNDHDVKVVKSTDGGNTWGTPVRVNDDPAGKEQFFSWMAIDQLTGYLYVVFYDRRNYTTTSTDVYLARSTNGGATWVNERISESPFTPTSGTFFGDYNGITAYNGKVRPIWTRLAGGSLSIWTAIIDFPVGIDPVSSQIPNSFELYQNFPNPFNPVTKIRFDIPSNLAGNILLKVYDQLGKEISTLVNGNLNAGTYEINWDASENSSGVYYYKLSASGESGNFSQTKKLVLVK